MSSSCLCTSPSIYPSTLLVLLLLLLLFFVQSKLQPSVYFTRKHRSIQNINQRLVQVNLYFNSNIMILKAAFTWPEDTILQNWKLRKVIRVTEVVTRGIIYLNFSVSLLQRWIGLSGWRPFCLWWIPGKFCSSKKGHKPFFPGTLPEAHGKDRNTVMSFVQQLITYSFWVRTLVNGADQLCADCAHDGGNGGHISPSFLDIYGCPQSY